MPMLGAHPDRSFSYELDISGEPKDSQELFSQWVIVLCQLGSFWPSGGYQKVPGGANLPYIGVVFTCGLY